jgi:hypothetical protein
MANPTMRGLVKLLESAMHDEISEAGEDSRFGAELERDADGRLIHKDISYDVKSTKGVPSKVTAKLGSQTSALFTKMAQKVQEAKSLAEELKSLEEDIKAEARGMIGDLFAPADEAMTRVVETVSFAIELKKAAKDVPSTKYASVLEEFTNHLTPELISVLNGLKEKYTTYGDKAGALSITAKVESVDLTEGPMDKFAAYFHKLAGYIRNWGNEYDEQLRALRIKLGGNDVNPITGESVEFDEAMGGPGYVNTDGSNMADSSAVNEEGDDIQSDDPQGRDFFRTVSEMNDIVNDAMTELNSLQIYMDNSSEGGDERISEAMEEFFHAALKFKAVLKSVHGSDLADPAF